jgi:hypothetical protein
MKARRGKNFPIFNITIADECPVCLSVLMSFDGKQVICAPCAAVMIKELKLALKVAQICNNNGSHFTQHSAFDNVISNLLKGKFGADK